MNDRYLFRAKHSSESKKQHIGNLVEEPDGLYLRDNKNNIMVYIQDPSTICQCTGLKDKNGKLIWENDIVKGKYYDNGKSHRHIGQVKYIYEAYKVVGVKQYTGYHAHLDGSYEVIGNIFDNKELLESEDKDENNY